jgi:hypothetical protein
VQAKKESKKENNAIQDRERADAATDVWGME